LLFAAGDPLGPGERRRFVRKYKIVDDFEIIITSYVPVVPKRASWFNIGESKKKLDLSFCGLIHHDMTISTHYFDIEDSVLCSKTATEIISLSPIPGAVLKEISLPMHEQVLKCLQAVGARPYKNFSGLYEIISLNNEQKVFVRLLPPSKSFRLHVSLKVDCITNAANILETTGIDFEKVGEKKIYNGSAEKTKSKEELHLTTCLSKGSQKSIIEENMNVTTSATPPLGIENMNISVRVCEHNDIQAFFNEGSNSVLEGTISSIQSDRVMGGAADVVESKFGYAGDCWVEFWAMSRERLRSVLGGDSQSSPHRSSYSPSPTVTMMKTPPIISRPPSIIE